MIKKIVICIIIALIFLISVYFGNKMIHFERNGLARDDALKIANRKLEIDFGNLPFLLKDETFEGFDKSWIFTYQKGDCLVDVIVDKRGVSDIGGLSAGCLPFQKK